MAVALVALACRRRFRPRHATTLEGAKQTISQGPVASQIAIKQLGTNGGGFFNANSAHPFENPSAWTNIITVWAIISLALGIAVAFGRMVGREREGWVIAGLMLAFMAFDGDLLGRRGGNAAPQRARPASSARNMEGKEDALRRGDVRCGPRPPPAPPMARVNSHARLASCRSAA